MSVIAYPDQSTIEYTRMSYIQALCAVFGYSAEDFVGLTLDEIVDSLDAVQLAAIYEYMRI